MGFIKYFYLMLSVLCDLPHSVTTEGDVGDPGEGRHGVLVSDGGEHDPVYVVPRHGVGEEEGDKLTR